MLEHFPIDIFRIIYQHLNVRDIHALASVNKGLQNTMLTDNPFWRDQFQRHFPYLIDKVIEKGEPESWYSIFKKTFIAEYELNLGDEKKQKEAYEKSILFSAAKNGDATELKKFFQTPDFLKKELCDKKGHSIYYWLYQNVDQHLLDSLFNEFSESLSEVDKFSFAILCNQQNYIEQCFISNISNEKFRLELLSLAVEIGSVDLVAILLKKFSVDKDNRSGFYNFFNLFVQAASLGQTDIVEFLHLQIRASKRVEMRPKLYCISIKQALEDAMFSGCKDTFKKLLSIHDKEIMGGPLNAVNLGGFDWCEGFIITKAAKMKDPDYADMLLQVGASPNLPPKSQPPLEIAIVNNNYEVSILLLKHGAKFDESDCAWAKELLLNPPKEIDPRLCVLAKLLIYKHEINYSTQTLSSFFSSNDSATVQRKVCDILLNVVTRKSFVKELSELNEIEKAALQEKDSTLNTIFEGFSEEIEKMKSAETKAKSNLNSIN